MKHYYNQEIGVSTSEIKQNRSTQEVDFNLKEKISNLNWKGWAVFSTVAHIPQIVNIIRGKSRKEARVFSNEDKFWTKKTIALHTASAVILLKGDKNDR